MFTRRLFNFGRQLIKPSVLSTFENPSIVQRNTILQKPNEVKFIRPPTVEQKTCQSIINNVNGLVKDQAEGRLFAVVHLMGKQYKITAGDILVIEGYWPPNNGDKIRLEKVLLVGGDDFTLTGRPLIQPNIVDVQATIIEKTLAHTRTNFRKKPRKNYMRIKFHRSPQTMVRINSITLYPEIDVNATTQELIE